MLTFEKLPEAVSEMMLKLESIEKLVLSRNENQERPLADELLTIKEAALFIKLSVPSVYRLCWNNEIPNCKKGKKLLFSKNDLIKWAKDGNRSTASDIQEQTDNYLTRKGAKKGVAKSMS